MKTSHASLVLTISALQDDDEEEEAGWLVTIQTIGEQCMTVIIRTTLPLVESVCRTLSKFDDRYVFILFVEILTQ